MRKREKDGMLLPPLIGTPTHDPNGEDNRSPSPLESASVTMRVGQEVELYFFLVENVEPMIVTFLTFEIVYKGFRGIYELHYEPCKSYKGVMSHATCVELVELSVPEIKDRSIANELLQLIISKMALLVLQQQDKAYTYQDFLEALKRCLKKSYGVTAVGMKSLVKDAEDILTQTSVCRDQYKWLLERRDFLMHVQWTFSFDGMQGLPVNRDFIRELKQICYKHDPKSRDGFKVFNDIVSQALRLNWNAIKGDDHKRFLFWFYVHLCSIDRTVQRCNVEHVQANDRIRVAAVEANKDNLTILDWSALNFRFASTHMFGKSMQDWLAELSTVADISHLQSMEPLCFRLNSCLAIEVRNTFNGGVYHIKGLSKVLRGNYDHAKRLAESADCAISNITHREKLPVINVPKAATGLLSRLGSRRQYCNSLPSIESNQQIVVRNNIDGGC